MLRAAVFSSFRCASRVALVSRMPIARTVPNASVVTRSRLLVPFMSSRFYSAPAGLTTTEVQERIMDLLKNFDKVRFHSDGFDDVLIPPGGRFIQGRTASNALSRPLSSSGQITSNSHFSKDLGLDSLDTVEVVMAIEEVGLGLGIG